MSSSLYGGNMRLFIAVSLTEREKEEIEARAKALAKELERGRMTQKELYHITLAFIGEATAAECGVIRDMLRNFSFQKFRLRFSGYGSFASREGKTLFIKAEEDEALQKLGEELREKLRAAGVKFDEKPLRPHITLARSAWLKPGSGVFEERVSLAAEVSEVALFRSDTTRGRRVYTNIFSAHGDS